MFASERLKSTLNNHVSHTKGLIISCLSVNLCANKTALKPDK
nr:MAG TPA: hypothetical protein [Caudoviricetes sp.]